ncbi:MAG TPA: hypothetical protein VHS96_18410 [Bacteroidia bacterium]|nr:hypothetical protein [Bacteroidia bacterium]
MKTENATPAEYKAAAVAYGRELAEAREMTFAKAKHTPGPWTVNQLIDTDNPDNDGVFVASLAPIYPNCNTSPKIGTLAQCYAVGDTRDISTVMANAALIAAAPELLAALRYLQAMPNDPRAHRAALDVLAKL